MRSRAACVVVLLIGGLLSGSASAQITQGRLTGVVTDTQGAVLPGVTVSVTSTALIGVQTTVSQPDGRYLFPALPSGTYKVNFELSGFQKLSRDNVQVVLGQTISVDAQLPIASLAETVLVTGDSPVIDVMTTKVGTDLKGEALVAVPNSTDVWGALSESPGIRMSGFDVGGSHKSQQSGYEVFGIRDQARVISDGVDHTEGVGGTGFYEDYYANEEVSVSGLGSDVEMNSGGASITTTIKSGGNQFHGLEHLSYEPGKFVGTNAAASDISGRGFTCPNNSLGQPQCDNPNLLFYEGHVDLGGPIARDKSWFYGAYNHFKINKAVAGISQSVATDLGIFDNETVKGTWKPSQNNTFIGYFQQGRKQKPKRGLSTVLPPESVLAQDSYSRMGKGEWQRVITSRAFLDVNAGSFYLGWPMVPQVDPATNPPLQFRGNSSRSGAGWLAFSTVRHKPQVKAQMTYYVPGTSAGSHDFKFGFEYLYDSYRYGHNGQSGPIRYSYAGTNTSRAPDRIIFVDTGTASTYGSGWTVGPNIDSHVAGYIQDRWSPNNRLTVTAGLRLDYQRVGYGDAIRTPQIHDQIPAGLDSACPTAPCFIFPASTNVTGQDFLKVTNPAPRLGVAYDVSGKGKTVLKAFYGHYYNNLADGFSAANPSDIRQATFNFIDAHGDQRYHGPENLGTLRSRTGGADAPVDPNMKNPYSEEISGSFETQLPGESAVRLTYVRKNQHNPAPYYGTNLIPAWVGHVNVPTVQTFNGQVFNLVDVPDSLADQTDGLYTNFPGDSDFHYDTIEAAYHKKLRQFFVQTSFDYQWRNDLRSPCNPCNTIDVSTSPLSADPIGTNFYFSANPAVPNRQKTTTYHFQFLGRYTLPYDVGVAANFRYQSGYPYAGVVPDGATSPGLNLSNLAAPFFVQNLDQNRSDNVALVNLRLDKSVPLGGRAKITGILDIYNLLNADPVTNFNLNVGPSYKNVIAVLDPRVFQLGVRLEF